MSGDKMNVMNGDAIIRDDVTIRRMTVEDIPDVMTIDRTAGLVPWSDDAFERELNNMLARYVVIEDGGDIVAFAGEWLVVDEAQIMKVAVTPDLQHTGYGKMLMAALTGLATREGCQTMTLEVKKQNAAALGLYRGFGFEITGERADYYPDGSDAYLMTRNL